MDEWNVDVVVCGVQKGFMMPPGLAMIALSDKAMKIVEKKVKMPDIILILDHTKRIIQIPPHLLHLLI